MPQHLTNQELDSSLKKLANREREVLHEILQHICEVDRRRLFLDFAYPSLFSYLTEACGYSPAAAQRRIDGARLMSAIPEVGEKIESGEMNLSQVSLMQKAIRQSDKSISINDKKEIVSAILNKTVEQSEKILARSFNLPIKESPHVTHQKDESVRLELTLTKEQWEKLLQARELLSSTTHSNDWTNLFEYFADRVIQQKKGPAITKGPCSRKNSNAPKPASAAEVKARQPSAARTHLSIRAKKQILARDKSCQYKDKLTGKICGTKWNLQIDHLQPVWAGGDNHPENLRVMCQRHNNFIYQNQASIRSCRKPFFRS